MGEERIDTALVMGDLPGALACVRLPVRWFGDPALASAEVVPLVAITPPCPFLDRAQRALDAAGRPWRLALVTPSLEGLRAAVLAGLGVTCRTEAGIGLPPLPEGMLPYQPDIACSVIGRRHAGEGFGTVATALANHLQRLATGSRP
jgi:DNA-binding transcriptional LysR family regulator